MIFVIIQKNFVIIVFILNYRGYGAMTKFFGSEPDKIITESRKSNQYARD